MSTGPTGPFYPGQTIPKDPDADLPFDVDWSEWLGDEATIASKDVSADTGITVESSAIVDTSTKVRIRLSGGTSGSTYNVRCRITTDETPPRIDDRSFRVRVVQR
jgi:hypothetical protein